MQAWTSHVARLLALLVIVVYSVQPSFISFLYLFLACVYMLRSGLLQLLWLPLFVSSSLVLLVRYLFQLPRVLDRYSTGVWAQWIGLRDLHHDYWSLYGLGGEILLLSLSCLKAYVAARAANAPMFSLSRRSQLFPSEHTRWLHGKALVNV